jgi:hypothetical protein
VLASVGDARSLDVCLDSRGPFIDADDADYAD